MAQKKKKDPLVFRMLRTTFSIYESIAPRAAARWGFKLFLSTLRYPVPAREKKLLDTATLGKIDFEGTPLQTYTWGKGPVILFMHGWSGRGLQVSEFVEPLLKQGFQVLAFDGPAHHQTPGKVTNLPELAKSLKAVLDQVGPIHALLTHSFGGPISLLAMEAGISVPKLITISAPTEGQGVIDEFRRRINASRFTGAYIKDEIERRFKRPFNEFAIEHTYKNVSADTDVLIIHDRTDDEAIFSHAERFQALLPQAETFFTEGLGHTRILRDAEVIRMATDFMTRETLVPQH